MVALWTIKVTAHSKCGVYTGERNYILSIRLDGATGSPENMEAVMCKRCCGRLYHRLKERMEVLI